MEQDMDNLPPVTCIGLANVDVVAQVDSDFMAQYNITKSASTLLDPAMMGTILGKLKNPVFHPGGCAANTACGLAVLDVPVRFVGHTGDDIYAKIFRDGFSAHNVIFDTKPFAQKMTSTCLTFITPDKDRSFAVCTDTAAWHISEDDLPDLPANGRHYVNTECNTAQMAVKGDRNLLLAIAEKYAGKGVNLIVNLNDMELVRRSLPTLHKLMTMDVALFMGNVEELKVLFGAKDQAEAFKKAMETGCNFTITDGPGGAYVIQDGKVEHAPAQPLHEGRIINTLGAGDQFAAGYIAALVNGLSPLDCCRTGIDAATQIIQQISARPAPRRAIRSA